MPPPHWGHSANTACREISQIAGAPTGCSVEVLGGAVGVIDADGTERTGRPRASSDRPPQIACRAAGSDRAAGTEGRDLVGGEAGLGQHLVGVRAQLGRRRTGEGGTVAIGAVETDRAGDDWGRPPVIEAN